MPYILYYIYYGNNKIDITYKHLLYTVFVTFGHFHDMLGSAGTGGSGHWMGQGHP